MINRIETKRKNYEEPQLVVIETEVKANIDDRIFNRRSRSSWRR